MLLARLSGSETAAWHDLRNVLRGFGNRSGLFQDLSIRRFGNKDGAPFQIRVRLAGQNQESNLVDVGYGVSQILPILVDTAIEERPRTFLMQQPEVHLHPRAQAELGSFLVQMVAKRQHRFLVETHSDALLDRVRLEVRDGQVSADLVRILYFERADGRVVIHPLRLDSAGNVTDAPLSYRRFFLEEEVKLIGASSVSDR
jgi:predicted ATPase